MANDESAVGPSHQPGQRREQRSEAWKTAVTVIQEAAVPPTRR
ncbi:hypothetical protein V1460_13900 [Streptomyces sp. SCSIO 30461]